MRYIYTYIYKERERKMRKILVVKFALNVNAFAI